MIDSNSRPCKPASFMLVALLTAATGSAQSACSGQIGDPSVAPTGGAGSTGMPGGGGGVGGSAGVKATPAAPQTFRRLTATQFRNSLRALLGSVVLSRIEEDSRFGGFTTIGATQVITSPDGVEKYKEAIDAALGQVFADTARRSALVSGTACPPKVAANDACTLSFIERFGRLAWRRPLTAAEVTRYLTLADMASQTLGDAYAGPRWAASALLQSPNFLYRVELGQPVPGRTDVWQLTSGEMASRLAFFLWDGPPDDQLLAAAEAGQLTSVEGIRTHGQRLLDSLTGRNAIADFARDLFWLSRLDNMAKDAILYPRFTPTLRQAMEQELTRLWEVAAFELDGSALDLFTTRRTFVNRELGALYGVPAAGLTDSVMSPVDLPAAGPRVGLLGSAALLSLYANQKEGSPTLRGKFIREELLCQIIPPPPDNVDTNLKDPPPGVVYTKREKLDQHRAQAACAGCHQAMDPLGFALENFDAIGAFRATDAGKPVDATGNLDGRAFDGLPGLAEAVKATPEAAICMVKHLYRYATGTAKAQGEDVAVDQLSGGFAEGGYKLRSLLLEIVLSEGFRLIAPAKS